jgi:hypothetical protein
MQVFLNPILVLVVISSLSIEINGLRPLRLNQQHRHGKVRRNKVFLYTNTNVPSDVTAISTHLLSFAGGATKKQIAVICNNMYANDVSPCAESRRQSCQTTSR